MNQQSESSLPVLKQIRTGKCQAPEVYKQKLGEDGWPTEVPSAYWKEVVEEVVVSSEGLVGNEAGHPSHIAEAQYRAAMIYNQLNNQHFQQFFPSHVISPGDFGENFVVEHPLMLSTEVCINDHYQIGTAIFAVTGPRFPCPKIDAAQKTKGIQKIGLENGWSGFFLRVIQPGICKTGDEIRLLSRPNPGFTIHRVASGMWGPSDRQDSSREFLEALSNMEGLMVRHFKDTAKSRLDRLLA